MKRNFILAGSLALSLAMGKAQDRETSNFKVNKSEVDLVYNHYLQDGDNSAVTGGLGTERLIVYGPSMRLRKNYGGKHQVEFGFGSDIISSASTDNIDFVMSSASRLDARTYTNLDYTRILKDGRLALSGGVSGSIESDYTSVGALLGTVYSPENKMTTLSASLQMFFDDLRWGRLQGGFLKPPIGLIYPEELRFREWYDVYNRNTFNLTLGYSRVINSRNVLELASILSYQEGLLSTPFHRVYFNDGTLVVEQLPEERFKAAFSAQVNSFLGGNIILKNGVHLYADSWDVLGVAIENETVYKFNARWSLHPSVRFYIQQAAEYFAPFGEHDPGEEFYSSDYDLSEFNSFTAGLRFAHSPNNENDQSLDTISMQYFYYGRSNNLSAHTISLVLNFSPKKER